MTGTPRPIKFESPGLGPAIVFIKSPLSASNLQPGLENLAHKDLNFLLHEAVSQIFILLMEQSVNLSTSKCLPTADLFLHGSNSADHSKNNTDTQQYAIQ